MADMGTCTSKGERKMMINPTGEFKEYMNCGIHVTIATKTREALKALAKAKNLEMEGLAAKILNDYVKKEMSTFHRYSRKYAKRYNSI